jgi:tetratricopeptide (TPR) repeat protein
MIFRRALIALALLLVACIGGFTILLVSVDWPAWHVGGYQRQVDDGTSVIAAATTDAARAAGHIQRGRGYAEIARYRHVFKSVGAAEYAGLYEKAIRDLDAAVQLDPENAAAFNARGLTYFERSWAASQDRFEPEAAVKTWLARAKADFTAIIDRDARNPTALDYRGMTNENLGDYIAAIDDYTRVAALDATLGTLRLADVYCRRGGTWIAQKAYDKAVADLEQSISLGANRDSCDCDPYLPLLWTYFEGLGDFDSSWTLVHRAQSNRRWLMPELVEKLKTVSRRNS